MNGFTNYILKPLTFIGALNWGLIGLFSFDLVAFLFGPGTMATRIIYSIVGVAALLWIVSMFSDKYEK